MKKLITKIVFIHLSISCLINTLFAGCDDLDSDNSTGLWEMSPKTPVISSGNVDSLLDYVAASDPHVVLRDDTFFLYYTCAGISETLPDEVRTRICLATSIDGITFVRYPDNPVLDLAAAGAWDSYNVETAFVLDDGEDIKLYYMGYDTEDAKAWLNGNGITLGSIGLAISDDGINFTRQGPDPVLEPSPGEGPCRCNVWDSWAVEGPWVLRQPDGTYWMWYGGAGSTDQGETEINGIGLAFSGDGIKWSRYFKNPVLVGDPGEWDEYHTIDPSVLVRDGIYNLWYHGGNQKGNSWYGNFQIGHATSPDGIRWTKSPENPVLLHGGEGTWSSFGVMAPSVIEIENRLYMYFHGLDEFPDLTVWAIGRAVPLTD